MPRPEKFKLSFALKQLSTPEGELHCSAPLVQNLIRLAELDETMLDAGEKLVTELREQLDAMLKGPSNQTP